MSSQVWKQLYTVILSVNRSIPREGRRPVYADTLIVAMYFWCVAHDRPLCWAARRENCRGMFRPKKIPSRSQFGRRIQSPRCQALLDKVYARLARPQEGTPFAYIDGRALVVGPNSQDPDAIPGRYSGGFARGYKLHAIVTQDGRFPHIRVTSLNASEPSVASQMIPQALFTGIVLADGNYDSGELYDQVFERGGMLVTPLPDNAGQGHHPQFQQRLIAAQIWKNGPPSFYNKRKEVERYLGQLSSFGGGLAPLPAWVRSLPRVTRWVTAKVILYHAKLLVREKVQTAQET